MKKEKQRKKTKNKREPIVKTRVKRDNTIEVELKNPSKSILGKIFIYLIVIGMTLGSLAGLILVIINIFN